jgi:hypothetical protein
MLHSGHHHPGHVGVLRLLHHRLGGSREALLQSLLDALGQSPAQTLSDTGADPGSDVMTDFGPGFAGFGHERLLHVGVVEVSIALAIAEVASHLAELLPEGRLLLLLLHSEGVGVVEVLVAFTSAVFAGGRHFLET